MAGQNGDLKTRVLTGALIAIVLTLVVSFSHISWVLTITIACLCLQAIFELYRATYSKDHKYVYYISYAVAPAVAILPIIGFEYIIAALFAIAVALFLYLMLNGKGEGNMATNYGEIEIKQRIMRITQPQSRDN